MDEADGVYKGSHARIMFAVCSINREIIRMEEAGDIPLRMK